MNDDECLSERHYNFVKLNFDNWLANKYAIAAHSIATVIT